LIPDLALLICNRLTLESGADCIHAGDLLFLCNLLRIGEKWLPILATFWPPSKANTQYILDRETRSDLIFEFSLISNGKVRPFKVIFLIEQTTPYRNDGVKNSFWADFLKIITFMSDSVFKRIIKNNHFKH
jgi:hypothetical protein